jgi:hypothetical protein
MTLVNDPRRAPPAPRVDTAAHLYKVGQAVRLKSGLGVSAVIYRITATIPPRGDSLQYRIRSDEERHERVTTQDNIEPVRATSGGAGDILMERTFSHGQGTATQQQRDQEAKAEEGSGEA